MLDHNISWISRRHKDISSYTGELLLSPSASHSPSGEDSELSDRDSLDEINYLSETGSEHRQSDCGSEKYSDSDSDSDDSVDVLLSILNSR